MGDFIDIGRPHRYSLREVARILWRRWTAYTRFDRAWTAAARADAAIYLAWMEQQGIDAADTMTTGLRLYCVTKKVEAR